MSSWKYTVNVVRAIEDDDGLYLEGEASGPERDTHGTEMSEEAIIDFARQIEERVEAGDPLPYIDHHLKSGSARQLGHIVRAWVDKNLHLKVRVQLDDLNPIARMVHEKVKRGIAKYGMSIKGDGTNVEWVKDDKTGRRFARFHKVILSEISHTSAPSWVPSFGTVLARSLDGETEEEMSDELTPAAAEEQTTAAVEAEQTPAASDEQTERSAEDTTPAVEEEAEDIERARIAQADKEKVVVAFNELAQKLRDLGIDPTSVVAQPEADAAATTENTEVENSETGETEVKGVEITREAVEEIVRDAIAPLSETIERQAQYIKVLENLPAGKVPAPIVREKFEKDTPNLEEMSPEERMRYALGAIYGN